MKILVIGAATDVEACKAKLGSGHTYSQVGTHTAAEAFLDSQDVIFDFLIEEDPHEFEIYKEKPITVFLNTCKISLSELAHLAGNSMQCTIFGFNGLPSFFNRSVLEVSLWQNKNRDKLAAVCKQLGTDFLLVDDRVGLVTPRVVAMIINEAYYTVQEGTATREDIDKAMKLGTNYPYGPFEWCSRIGVKHVYELLEAIYEDTKDERYKICPLLKKEYLNIT